MAKNGKDSKDVKHPQPDNQGLIAMENMNATIAEAWDALGYFKKIIIPKATMVKMANMEGMPLSGIDVINTQQGPKIYINSEGAKYNRDKYLHSQSREVSGRTVEIFDSIPGSNLEQDKAQGRKYFKVTTTIKTREYERVIVGITEGKVETKVGMELLEQITKANTYVSWSAFSNVSETYNKVPEHILKKGQTQAHRRADLEISKQVVLPADDEPLDAQFVVKGAPDPSDVAKLAGAGAVTALVPEAPEGAAAQAPPPAPEPPKPEPPKPEPPKQDDKALVKERIDQLSAIFVKAGMDKTARIKWLGENGLITSSKGATIEALDKAIAVAKEKLEKPPEAPKEPPKEAPKDAPKGDPAKAEVLHKVFGLREKAAFASDDEVRAWVKKIFGKGLSEMSATDVAPVVERISAIATILANHKKWEMASPESILDWAVQSEGKPLHDMTMEELKTVEEKLSGSF